MLSVLIATTLAASSPQTNSAPPSAAYADCVLAHLQPGLSDRAIPLLQQACASKHPESYVASAELERTYSAQRQARFDADRAAAERAANAAASAAQAAAEREAARAQGAKAR
ncbi:hypothetical protein [Stenotrophomonas maltophilia]|uniref:hypothetical protein n=1 Tax=Stenotrophomonas maltophilia TaxID=40324 RepID=UPI0013DCE94C|nr:hypothetical protein [Stenotrophomonas maltophilia]MDT3485506.1 hypothetical protein [Stenotrophomonas maltophilia]